MIVVAFYYQFFQGIPHYVGSTLPVKLLLGSSSKKARLVAPKWLTLVSQEQPVALNLHF